MNEVLKAIAERSSIRAYKKDKLSGEQIKALVRAGLAAPTATNRQEIHISVLDGEHTLLQEIEQEKRRFFAAKLDGEEREKLLDAPGNFYYDAPIVFILSVDREFGWSHMDAGIAAENISLAAQSLGLGSVILGVIKGALTGEKREYFAKALDFPENYEFAIAVAAGYKDTEKEPHTFDEKASVSYIGSEEPGPTA